RPGVKSTVGAALAPRNAVAAPAPLLQELAGVHDPAVVPDLEMHVGAGGAAGGAGLGHLLPGADQVAGPHQQARVVRVAGHVTVSMVDLHHLAVARAGAGVTDDAVGHRVHRIAGAGVEVQALVVLAATAERIGAATEARGDVAVGDRSARRG